jgi:hypothetical protein
MAFKFTITQCDVTNQLLLASYRQMREKWLSWLDHNEPNSIDNQVYNLMWWDAVFWTLNEARKFTDSNSPSSAITPILAEFIDQGYLALQILSISKLLEKNSTNPRYGVISLRRLIDEIVENRSLFTRENYVCHDGLPYDPEPARQRFFAQMSASPARVVSLSTEGPDAWDMSERLHTQFDKLAKTNPENRRRDDIISEDVFNALKSIFDDSAFGHVIGLRHKIFAHAADSHSRSYARTNIDKVELGQIVQAQKNLLQLMQIVSSVILQAANFTSAIAIPQFNHFKHINLPYVREENKRKLSTFWDSHAKERREWLQQSAKTILPNFT